MRFANQCLLAALTLPFISAFYVPSVIQSHHVFQPKKVPDMDSLETTKLQMAENDESTNKPKKNLKEQIISSELIDRSKIAEILNVSTVHYSLSLYRTKMVEMARFSNDRNSFYENVSNTGY